MTDVKACRAWTVEGTLVVERPDGSIFVDLGFGERAEFASVDDLASSSLAKPERQEPCAFPTGCKKGRCGGCQETKTKFARVIRLLRPDPAPSGDYVDDMTEISPPTMVESCEVTVASAMDDEGVWQGVTLRFTDLEDQPVSDLFCMPADWARLIGRSLLTKAYEADRPLEEGELG